jgi:hypothetical protein
MGSDSTRSGRLSGSATFDKQTWVEPFPSVNETET